MKEMLKKNVYKCRIGTKILIAFLALSLISLVSFGCIALGTLKEVGDYSEESSTELGESATNDSVSALRELGEKMIEQKARDVAEQMDIYMTLNDDLTISDLQGDPKFQAIAVQSVGETGYTVALDINNGTYYFHKFTEVFVNKSSKELFTDPVSDYYNPHVWNLINQTVGTHNDSSGYYEWIEPVSGAKKEKYVAFAVANATTANDIQMFVAATTYIDEFLRPVEETKRKIDTATKQSNEHIDGEIKKIQHTFLGILVLLVMVVFLLAVVTSKKITNPILELMKGAESVGRGELDYRVDIKTGDELEDLAHSFNNMASDLKLQMNKLAITTREKERIERELQIAHEIQKSFLPIKAPEIEGYKIAGLNLPAREVGGDFYDFIELGEEKIGIVIADVSGKGVPAALFVGISKTLFRANVKRILDPVEALKEVNSIIIDESDSGMFVTLFYAILDLKNEKLTFINAGHNPPILLKKDNMDITLLKAKGIPIGIVEDMQLESKEILLERNELIFLYTDGVTEAVNEKDEEFGMERLEHILTEEKENTPDALIEKIIREIKQFAGKREQFDDITMVVLQSENV